MAESVKLCEPKRTAPTDDRISRLPDELLRHILSFLPTATAVSTSLLSRRWRYTWHHLQSFDFCRYHLGQSESRFVALVNGALNQRKARDIRKFCLTYFSMTMTDGGTGKHAAAAWVCAAVGPHLENLDLYISSSVIFVVPPTLLTCTALVDLKLTGNISAAALLAEEPSPVHLPSLKTLLIDLNCYDNVNALFAGCPVLQTLKIRFKNRVSPNKSSAPKIRVPSLKSLTISDWFPREFDNEIVELEIDTPALEFLCFFIAAKCYRISINHNLPNAVEARLSLGDDSFVLELLRALSSTKYLSLHQPTMTSLLLLAPRLHLPEFRCLLDLELTLPYFDTSFLVNMLHKCHMLRVLTIHKTMGISSDWTQPTSVPECLVSHLSIINFSKYYGSGDDQEFIGYILREGLVLTAVKIHIPLEVDSKKKHGISEELSLMPRASKMCQLSVSY